MSKCPFSVLINVAPMPLFSKATTWKSILKRANDWHEWVVHQEYLDKENERWVSVIGSHSSLSERGMQIIALTNGKEVVLEGRVMHHCVGTYINNCVKGNSRIFSIRSSEGARGDYSEKK